MRGLEGGAKERAARVTAPEGSGEFVPNHDPMLAKVSAPGALLGLLFGVSVWLSTHYRDNKKIPASSPLQPISTNSSDLES